MASSITGFYFILNIFYVEPYFQKDFLYDFFYLFFILFNATRIIGNIVSLYMLIEQ